MEDLKVLIIGHTWPEPKATAAGGRMMQLIQFFLTHGYSISFGSTANNIDKGADLDQLGVQSIKLLLNDQSFDTYLQQLKPDIVVFDRFITEEQFGWRVTEFAPNAIKILDTEDLHSLRLARKQALEKQTVFTNKLWRQHQHTIREVAAIYRCDLSLIISEYEMQLLTKELGIPASQLLYLPYMLDPLEVEETKDWLPFEEREHFVFIGTGKHPPNVDAIKWLKMEIWPLIKEALPATQLHIYGAYLPQAVKQFNHQTEGFIVKGWAEDANMSMSRAKVNLAPLRYGAGIKGKLVLAMRQGTPNVATKVGAEGISGYFQNQGCANDDAMEFAKQAIDLYTNKRQWSAIQLKGLNAINQQFNKSVHYTSLNKAIVHLQTNLSQHRIQNFTGAMLMHHTMAASMYLAKWITAKNT
ncbi:glycosyltransferase [Muriicola sp. Z0-33]|uniref:glycosyltransferase n=1 Tax=Muriicola sp. Z0-33 TaxID=2816957 RepID=UPI002238A920|nr:glycosyltransferase family 4 protein [Muriicola sp. Z0-33]MCW5515203.1 glycosyltransferase [Muriicola sp. Z0-33]